MPGRTEAGAVLPLSEDLGQDSYGAASSKPHDQTGSYQLHETGWVIFAKVSGEVAVETNGLVPLNKSGGDCAGAARMSNPDLGSEPCQVPGCLPAQTEVEVLYMVEIRLIEATYGTEVRFGHGHEGATDGGYLFMSGGHFMVVVVHTCEIRV